jgi:hypothetical protein
MFFVLCIKESKRAEEDILKKRIEKIHRDEEIKDLKKEIEKRDEEIKKRMKK